MNHLAMIVAASENNVIGVDGDLPWHLSADLKRFKKLTMGHHMIRGRKTFDSIGRPLPGRTTVIVTRQQDYSFEGAKIAHSVEQAVELSAEDPCPFIVGGAQIYLAAMPLVNRLFLTRVQTEIKGDTFLPEIDWSDWELESSERGSAEVEFTFEDYVRKTGTGAAPNR